MNSNILAIKNTKNKSIKLASTVLTKDKDELKLL